MKRIFGVLSVLLLLSVVLGGAPALAEPDGQVAIAAPHAGCVVLVGFAPGTHAAERANIRRAAGAVNAQVLSPLATDAEKLELGPGRTVEQAIAALIHNPNVVYAEPDYLLQSVDASNDTYYTSGSLWGMYGDNTSPANQYGSAAGEAWNAGFTGSGNIYVGVIDEGIQYTHPDLAANVWTNQFDVAGDGIDNDGNGKIDDVHGWDFYNNDNSVYDGPSDDHATHVAGTIGAEGGNTAGVAGVNWHVTMISTKFLGPSGGYTSGAVAALDYLTDLKKRHTLNVVATNNSWGGGGFSQSLLDAINRAGDQNILFVAAAGNNGSNNDSTAFYPANYQGVTRYDTKQPRGYDCVIAVAAIDSNGAKSSFSNYGAATIDIGAPGSSILSTVPTNSYAYYSGTSMATPHVTGAIALAASANTALTPQQLRGAVLNSVTLTTSLSSITVTGGRLDIGKMLDMVSPDPNNHAPVADGQSVTTFQDSPKPITLTSTDPDNDPLSFSIASGPSHGTLSAISNNVTTYTPAAGYYGADSFTFTTFDGKAISSPAVVSITVSPKPDFAISASPANRTVARGKPATYAVTVTFVGGYTSSVDLTLTSSPAAVQYSFAPVSLTSTGTSTLTIRAPNKGSYSLTITGTQRDGTLSHSTAVQLKVK